MALLMTYSFGYINSFASYWVFFQDISIQTGLTLVYRLDLVKREG